MNTTFGSVCIGLCIRRRSHCRIGYYPLSVYAPTAPTSGSGGRERLQKMLGAFVGLCECQDRRGRGKGRGRRVLGQQAVHEARVQASDVHAAERWWDHNLRVCE